MKRWMILAALFLLILLLTLFCGRQLFLQGSDNVLQAFRLETDCILIYTADDAFAFPVKITDPQVIDELVSVVNLAQWKEVPFEQEISAIPYYCVDFQNGTVITLLHDTAYGSIGSGLTIQRDGTGQISTLGLDPPSYGPFYLNEAFFTIIKNLTTPNV